MEPLILDVLEFKPLLISPSEILYEILAVFGLCSSEESVSETLLNTYLLL